MELAERDVTRRLQPETVTCGAGAPHAFDGVWTGGEAVCTREREKGKGASSGYGFLSGQWLTEVKRSRPMASWVLVYTAHVPLAQTHTPTAGQAARLLSTPDLP